MTGRDRERADFGAGGSGAGGSGGGAGREPDERLAAYLDGEMTERERARFEGELRVNQQLAAELAAYERTVLSVRSALQAPTRSVDLADRVLVAVTAGPERPTAGGGGASGAGTGGGYRWFTSIAAAAALLVVAILIHSLASELPLAPESASVVQDEAPPTEPTLNRFEAAYREPDGQAAGSKANSEDRKAAALELERGSWSKQPDAGAIEPEGNADSEQAKGTGPDGAVPGDPKRYRLGPADKVPARRGVRGAGASGAAEPTVPPVGERNKGEVRLAQKELDELPTVTMLGKAPPPTKSARSKSSSANDRAALADPAPAEAEVLADAGGRSSGSLEASERLQEERKASSTDEGAGEGRADVPAKKAKVVVDTLRSATPRTGETRAESARTGSDDFFLGAARERRRAFRVPPAVTLPFLQLTRTVAPVGLGGGAGGGRTPERGAPGAKPNPNPTPASPRGGVTGPVTGGPAGPATGGPSASGRPSTPGPSTPGARSAGPAGPGPAGPGSAGPGSAGPGARVARSSAVRTVSTRAFVAEEIAGSAAAVLDRRAPAEAAPDPRAKSGERRGRVSTTAGLARFGERRFAGLELVDVTHWFAAGARDRGLASGVTGKTATGEESPGALAPGERVWLVAGDRATVARLMREMSTIARSASYRLKNGEVRVPVQDRAVAVRFGLPMAGGEPEQGLRDEASSSGSARDEGGAEKATSETGTKAPADAQDRMTLLLRFRTVATK